LQEAASKRLDMINARWSRDDAGGDSGGSEDEQGSEEENADRPARAAAPAPTAAELGIDPRLLEPDALDGPPVARRAPKIRPLDSSPSFGVGLSVGLSSHDEESSEVASDETEDEMPTY
jgi:hypothetical protein